MLTDITLGQYFPGNSFIHKLDPRTKLLATLIYIIAIFFAVTPLAYGILTAFAAAVIIISRVPMDAGLQITEAYLDYCYSDDADSYVYRSR